eukprot:SAG25_NODE_704_length_5847_cov_3.595338_1_plen_45_part_00
MASPFFAALLCRGIAMRLLKIYSVARGGSGKSLWRVVGCLMMQR